MALRIQRKKDNRVVKCVLHRVADIPGGVTVKVADLGGNALFEGTPLGNGEVTDISKSFTHLGLVSTDLKNLKIEFYDKDKALKYTGYFDTTNKKIKKDKSEETGN